MHDELETILEKKFGFKSFRPGQREAIVALLNRGNLLCIQPTGHGKSLLYQLPSCILGGLTIVISPLLALMRDQIDHLQNRFKIPAASINSDQSEEENYQARQAALHGKLQVLFVAPEQLDHVDRFDFLLKLQPKLLVIDEAHCISTWGHDFRPSYRQILTFVKAVNQSNPHIKILGLTATANQRVQQDIAQQLTLAQQRPLVMRETMNRPNIQLSSIECKGVATKLAVCEKLLKTLEGCGLIYCSTRENCVLVADYLKEQHLPVVAYHAGFGQEEKRKLQDEFILDKYKALAATNALGMGIDKSNLRFIIHFDVPGSITAYYQEVGRCGRDGNKAQGILIYDPADKRVQDYFIASALPSEEDFKLVLNAVKSAPSPPNLTTIKQLTGLHPTRVTIIVAELIEQNFLHKFSDEGKQLYQAVPNYSFPDLSRYTTQYRVKINELKSMLSYAEGQECRMSRLRTALGEEEHVLSCGHCDVCSPKQIKPEISLEKVKQIESWVAKRPVVIEAYVKNKISEGLSVLDGKARTPLFVNFMHQRAAAPANSFGMEPELLNLLSSHLKNLVGSRTIAGIIPIPSKTWQARDKVAGFLANLLSVPIYNNLLFWNEIPSKRQGELFNNDQRRLNVHEKMAAKGDLITPGGILIIFDDYIGSGHTLREAVRALRTNRSVKHEIVPFTVAALKWHLGRPGFA